jgi:hypothetical protein
MKKILPISFILLLSFFNILGQASENSRHLKPTNFIRKVTTVVSGKERSYYSLDVQQASIISVQGPGILELKTRGRFVPGQGDYISYEVLYTIDGGEQKRFKASDAVRSSDATYLKGTLGVPGQRKDFEIELDLGDHTIEFYLKAEEIPVAVQYFFTPTKEKTIDWVEISPLHPSNPVDLVTQETVTCYYLFSEDNPLLISVNGPTELRVFTRMEFTYQMQGRANYRIQAMEGEKVLNTYQMSSTRSDVTGFKNQKDMVPGKASEFVINVPEGNHIYRIVPLDQDKTNLLGRFMIPKTDVKLSK